ncbi:hypothetical protein VZT92_007002 [Zoarces viviparus]|uniref:Uncharacterized protein n=1 Tax=Zoarces viviparus TaxID=48416 RepID=A0AAW1FIK6_ZOAVI
MPSARSACQAPCGRSGRPEKTELLEDSGLAGANAALVPGTATVASVCWCIAPPFTRRHTAGLGGGEGSNHQGTAGPSGPRRRTDPM